MGRLAGKHIGWALAASHCSFEEVLPHIERLRSEGAEVLAILSEHATDTRFGTVEEWVQRLQQTTGRRVLRSIVETEPLGPQRLLDALVIAPCTGNTLAKLALAITDSAVLMVHFLCDGLRPSLEGTTGSGTLASCARLIARSGL